MTQTLRTQTRTLDLSGLSGNPSNSDGKLWPINGAVVGDVTYGTVDGETGIIVNDTADSGIHEVLLTAFGAVWDTSEVFAGTEFSVEFDIDLSQTGGVILQHFAHSTSGSAQSTFRSEPNGKGIRFQFLESTESVLIQTRASDTGGFTLVDSDTHGLGDTGVARFRISGSRTGTNNTFTVESVSGGVYTEVVSATIADAAGTVPSLACLSIASSAIEDARVKNIVCTRQGVNRIAFMASQSEGLGTASTATDAEYDRIDALYHDLTFGQANEVDSGKGATGGTAASNYGGIASYTSATGSLMLRIFGRVPGETVISTIGSEGSTDAADHDPPPATNRYGVGHKHGVRCLFSMLFAGDGRNGTEVNWIWYVGSLDARQATTEAAFEQDLQDVADDIAAQFPTATLWVVLQGDRTWKTSIPNDPANVSQSESDAIRDAELSVIASRDNTKLLVDDDIVIGESGFINSEDSGAHPGTDDLDILASRAAQFFAESSTLQRVGYGVGLGIGSGL